MIKKVTLASALFALTAVAAWTQQPPTVRIAGTIESFDGRRLAVRSEKLGEVKIDLADDTVVFGVMKATLAEVKPGAYVGIGAMPQPDGSRRAVQVTVFADSLRGLGEGHRPWRAHPNGTMTNGSIGETVANVDGRVLTVKYKGGEKKIVVPSDAAILAYSPGDKAELKPGAHVAILRATRKPDGSLAVNRVNVGRGGFIPR